MIVESLQLHAGGVRRRLLSLRGGVQVRSSRRLVVVLVVSVVAVVAVGASAFASGSPPPQRVAVSGVEVVSGSGAGELSVTWDVHDAGPVNYRVSWRPAGERFRRAADVEWNAFPSGAEHVISGLVPGGVYEVRVRARFGGSGSRWSDVVSGAAAAHPAPAQDLAVPQSLSAPVPEEPLEHARGHQDPLPGLSIGHGEHFEEGALEMIFGVGLNAMSSHEVSVNYSTSIEDGDTAEPNDFVPAAGTVTFLPGQVFAQFGVALNNDNVYEGNETFTVTLTNAMNAALPSPSTATGTILDDETEPTISIADASDDEGDELLFEVTLSGPSERNGEFRLGRGASSRATRRRRP